MVEHGDAHKLARFDQAAGQVDILGAGIKKTGGMVMHQNDRSGRAEDGELKDLTGMHDGAVQIADRYQVKGNNGVVRIQADDAELLTVGVDEKRADRFEDYIRRNKRLAIQQAGSAAGGLAGVFNH